MRFVLASGSLREVQTERQLRSILGVYPAVSDWVFTGDIRIEAKLVPHSHPVLTLNTCHLDDDHQLLATFVHEQLHWGVKPLDNQLITELEGRYPDLPIGAPAGCRNRFSNYLHLVICSLEYQALINLLGETIARATLLRVPHYQRIYQIILTDHAELLPLIQDHVELERPGPGCLEKGGCR